LPPRPTLRSVVKANEVRTAAVALSVVALPIAEGRTVEVALTAADFAGVSTAAAGRVSAGPVDFMAAATPAAAVLVAGFPPRPGKEAAARSAALADLALVLTATPATAEAAVPRLGASRMPRASRTRSGTPEVPLPHER
jgi:hypothetical protein